MVIVNRALTFQNYQNISEVIAERTKPVSENTEPIQSEEINLSDFALMAPWWSSRMKKRLGSYSRPPA